MEISDDKLLRKQGVADMLGISRDTLGRIIKADPEFPKFVELSPSIRMVRAREIRIWLARKTLQTREKSMDAQSASS